jgi:uncharacterized protein YggE
VNSTDPASAPFVLSASVEGEGADTNIATVAANGKLTGLKTALEKAGVASSSIQLTSFSVYPHFEQSPTDPSTPTVTKHKAYIGIQVVVIGLEKVGVALNAALSAGAANVNAYVAGTSGQSSAGDVTVGVGEAMGQARALATATAASAGLRLGRLVSIDVKPAGGVIAGQTATFLVGADLSGYRGIRPGVGGQTVEVIATYEALP